LGDDMAISGLIISISVGCALISASHLDIKKSNMGKKIIQQSPVPLRTTIISECKINSKNVLYMCRFVGNASSAYTEELQIAKSINGSTLLKGKHGASPKCVRVRIVTQ
jgi:hypothetical protein